MKPSSCKSKGRRLQQQVARDVLTAFPHLTTDDVRSTPMGAHGEDVMLSARARQCFPFSVEAKNAERLNIWAAIDQNAKNANGHRRLIVFKKNRSEVYAAVEWSVLLDMMAGTRGGRVATEAQEALVHLQRASDALRPLVGVGAETVVVDAAAPSTERGSQQACCELARLTAPREVHAGADPGGARWRHEHADCDGDHASRDDADSDRCRHDKL